MQFSTIFTTGLVLTTLCSSSLCLANNDDYISANGVKIELGQSQRYLESKLGIPHREVDQFVFWTLENGNHLSISFDEYGASSATLSGTQPDFLYAHGKKVVLGQDSLNSSQKKHPYGCYHQGWGEGLVGEYVVRSGPEGSWLLNFAHFSHTDDEKILKNHVLTSISLTYEQPYGEEQYCTY